jgi:hypothetical protein
MQTKWKHPVNKAFITTTNDVIVQKSQDSTYSSSLYSQDSTYSSSLSIIARFDILIFALLSNHETRHTRLRSHREIRLIFAFKWRDSALVFALIREIRHTHLHSYRETQLVFGPTHRFITIQGTPTSRKINAIKMRWYIDLYFAQSQCNDRLEFRSISIRRSIWISLHQNATIHRFKFRFIKMRRYIDLDFASSKCDDTSIWISLHQNVTIELLR